MIKDNQYQIYIRTLHLFTRTISSLSLTKYKNL